MTLLRNFRSGLFGGTGPLQVVGLLSLSALMLILLFYMSRLGERRASSWWALAWLALWTGGLIIWLPAEGALRAFASVLGGLYAAALLAGAHCYREPAARVLPVLALGLGLGAASGALGVLGFAGPAYAVTRAEGVLILAAGLVVWRTPPCAIGSAAQRWLGACLLALGALHVFEFVPRALGAPNVVEIGLWGTLAFATAMAQLVAFFERVRASERESVERAEAHARALTAEQDLLRAMIESMPAGIVLVGSDGRVRLHNREATRMAGLASGESWHGEDIEELVDREAQNVPEALRDGLVAAVRALGREPESGPPVEVPLGDPPRTWIRLSAHAVRSAHDDWLGRLWVIRDVTEARRAEEKLGQARRVEALGTFVGGIAHDYNNQLTTLLGNAELLRSSLAEEDPRRAWVRDLERAAQHSAELTRGLLDFGRRSDARPRPIDLGEELAALRPVLSPRLPAGTRLEFDLAPGLPALLADATQLRRVLENLVANAADAGAQTIRIAARHLAPDPDEPDRAAIDVVDDGSGMDEPTRERLFDPFFTTRENGTGLGLSIVYGVVRAHGAEIEVESAPGRGTRIHLTWPTAGAPAVHPAPAPRAVPTGLGRQVLIAEDQDEVRSLARRALAREGYGVIEVRDGVEASRLSEAEVAELSAAVLDLSMPGRSGLDALVSLRRVRPKLPAVLITGWLAPEQRQELPPDVTVLLKPFRAADLVRAVGAAIVTGSEVPSA